MGYGLPAAIGAKIGSPNKRVINISGQEFSDVIAGTWYNKAKCLALKLL